MSSSSSTSSSSPSSTVAMIQTGTPVPSGIVTPTGTPVPSGSVTSSTPSALPTIQDIKAILLNGEVKCDKNANNFYVPLSFVMTTSTSSNMRKAFDFDSRTPIAFRPLFLFDRDPYPDSKQESFTVFPSQHEHSALINDLRHLDSIMEPFLKNNMDQLIAARKKCRQTQRKLLNKDDDQAPTYKPLLKPYKDGFLVSSKIDDPDYRPWFCQTFKIKPKEPGKFPKRLDGIVFRSEQAYEAKKYSATDAKQCVLRYICEQQVLQQTAKKESFVACPVFRVHGKLIWAGQKHTIRLELTLQHCHFITKPMDNTFGFNGQTFQCTNDEEEMSPPPAKRPCLADPRDMEIQSCIQSFTEVPMLSGQ